MRRSHVVVWSAIIVSALATGAAQTQEAGAARAPARSVMINYDAGVNAIKAEQWPDAIASLNNAIAMDPYPRTYKEGIFMGEYFPQYYLFVAYVKTKNFAEARRFYALRGRLPERLSADARVYMHELTNAEQAVEVAKQAHAQGALPGAVAVNADKIDVLETTTMIGNVTLVVNGITLRADEAVYTKGTRTLTFKGNVTAILPEGVGLAAK